MLNRGKEKNCGFSDEIVAYIYDEISDPERRKFETHLADCMSCTDEFADISNARFAMFEWRREEFAHLPTPEIVIPYAKAKNVEAVGFFGGLRALLSFPSLSSATLVAGVLAVCVGLGCVVINYMGGVQQVADSDKPSVNEHKVSPAVAQNPESVALPAVPSQKEPNTTGTMTSASTRSVPSLELRPVKASLKMQRVRVGKNLTASRRTETAQPRQKAPALTAYDEEDDGSLRLADLFDGGGS